MDILRSRNIPNIRHTKVLFFMRFAGNLNGAFANVTDAVTLTSTLNRISEVVLKRGDVTKHQDVDLCALSVLRMTSLHTTRLTLLRQTA